MLEFLPREVREGLLRAEKRASPRSRRLAVHLGGAVYPIRRIWEDGFSIEAVKVSHLRGFIEIHEGPRHILSCLILAADIEDDELICRFKRVSAVRDRAPLDYEAEGDLPAGYLPRA